MPKIPARGGLLALPTKAPLAASKPQAFLVDRWSDLIRVTTLKPSDVTPQIAEWLADPAIMEGLNAPKAAMGLDAFRAYVASFDNVRRSLVSIQQKSDALPVGLMMLELDLRHKIGSLHTVIGDKGSRNAGIATHAVTIMMWHFFRDRRMEKLTLQPLSRNRAAVAVCRLNRLTHEGTLRSHRIDGRTGERLDQMIFGMTRAEFDDRVEKLARQGTPNPIGGSAVAR